MKLVSVSVDVGAMERVNGVPSFPIRLNHVVVDCPRGRYLVYKAYTVEKPAAVKGQA